MERLVLLVSKFFLVIGLTACSSDYSFVKKNSEELNLRKKVVEFNKVPYTGFVYDLYESGDTLSTEFYKNGLKHNSWKKFYPGGSLKEVRFFKNGEKEGKSSST